jgi:hypothetical protein
MGADQSAEDNRSEQNLVLMCVEHANAIDEPSTLSAYPVERLPEWKAKQIEEYDRLKQGWTIDSEMAKGAIQASCSNVGVVVSESTVHLGGHGGKAPAPRVAVGELWATARPEEAEALGVTTSISKELREKRRAVVAEARARSAIMQTAAREAARANMSALR